MMNKFIPDIEFKPEGLVMPTEQDILNGVFNMLDSAFGSELNRNLETPQGQLASSLTAILADKNNQIAWLYNNLDPMYSDGKMQDAIGNIYFLSRKGQINSTAVCEFVGAVGTVIPKGYEILDTNNNSWFLNENISILSSGKVNGNVTATGVYSAEKGGISKLRTSITGLDRVTNPEAAIVGVHKESRVEYGKRIKKSVAKNAQGMPATVYSNVSDLKGVLDCYVVDNRKHQAVTVGVTNYKLEPHSIYVAVVGGDDYEIAKTIWKFAGNGCDFNGNKSINIEDDLYHKPRPSYEIKFMRPENVPIYIQVKIRRGAEQGYEDIVKNAILEHSQRDVSDKIGGFIYGMDYSTSIIKALSSNTKLLDIDVSKSKGNYQDSLQLGIDQYPLITAENISVVLV